MKFTTLFSLVASATLAIAQSGDPTDHFDPVSSPARDQSVKAGSTFNIVWEPTKEFNDETISIKLMGGKTPGTLQPMDEPIATGIKNSEGTYAWKIKSSLGKDATYGLALVLESDPKTFQYSLPFHIKKAAGGSDDDTDSTASGTATNSGTATSSDSETKTSSEDETSTSMTMTTSTKAPKTTKTTESSSESESASTTMAPSTTESSASATESQTSSSASAEPSSGAAAIGANGILALGGVVAAILAL